MATIASGFNPQKDMCCDKILLATEQMNDPAVKTRPTAGLTEALLSAENRAGFSLELPKSIVGYTPTAGKKVYTKAIKQNCDPSGAKRDVCDDTVSSEALQDMYVTSEHTVEQYVKRTITVNEYDFAAFCESPEAYINNRLLAYRNGVIQEINQKLVDTVLGYMGAYSYQTGVDTSVTVPESVSLIAPNSFVGGTVYSNTGYAHIVNHYARLNYLGSPIVVGGQHVGHLVGMGGTAPQIPNIYVDYSVDTTINDTLFHLLSWMPGTLQLVTYNEITDALISKNIVGKRERITAINPFGESASAGLEWDVYVDHSDSGCLMSITYQLNFDVICPTPYDLTCGKKPALHFLSDCVQMDCLAISKNS